MTMDLIERQAAIEALCKAGCDSTYCGVSCPDVVAIENLPSAQSEQRWIPVTERLPEKFYERVLICGKMGGIAIANYRNILPGVSPFWVQGNKTMEAVAWMPLPKPYKE